MSSAESSGWTYLTNHSHVLLCIARDSGVRLREISERVGITKRAVQMIILDLERAGVIEKRRHGRRNFYELSSEKHLRHPVEAHCTVADLIAFVDGTNRSA